MVTHSYGHMDTREKVFPIHRPSILHGVLVQLQPSPTHVYYEARQFVVIRVCEFCCWKFKTNYKNKIRVGRKNQLSPECVCVHTWVNSSGYITSSKWNVGLESGSLQIFPDLQVGKQVGMLLTRLEQTRGLVGRQVGKQVGMLSTRLEQTRGLEGMQVGKQVGMLLTRLEQTRGLVGMFLKSGLIYYYLPSRKRSGCVFLEIPKLGGQCYLPLKVPTLLTFVRVSQNSQKQVALSAVESTTLLF